VFKLNL